MERTGRVAIGRHWSRGKENLVLIRPYKDGLILHQVYYADEMRDFGAIDLGDDVSFKPGEEQLADQLIEQLTSEEFEPDKYRDEYRDRVLAAVEQKVPFSEAEVRLRLRVDRIDRNDDGTITILDYKTGAKKTLLDGSGQPREVQLIAYAMALDDPIGALALVNVDAREISFDGAGTGFANDDNWEASLREWKDLVRKACRDLSAGDVRTPATQGIQDARPFNLLSRYTELLRGT